MKCLFLKASFFSALLALTFSLATKGLAETKGNSSSAQTATTSSIESTVQSPPDNKTNDFEKIKLDALSAAAKDNSESQSAHTFSENQKPDEDSEIDDPMEEWNRSVLSFNCLIRDIFIHPLSYLYENIVPECIQKGIRNVISNLAQPFSVINSILQMNGEKTQLHLTKLLINTTFGICGWVDIAGLMNLSPEEETFGKTLKCAGVGPGPFMMLPILGPCHLRNSIGITVDFFLQVPGYSALYSVIQNSMQSLIDYCDYKEPWKLIEEKFEDPYLAIRHAYYEAQGDLKTSEVGESESEADEFDDEEIKNQKPETSAITSASSVVSPNSQRPEKDTLSPSEKNSVQPAEEKQKSPSGSTATDQKKDSSAATAENKASQPTPPSKSEASDDATLFPGIDDVDMI